MSGKAGSKLHDKHQALLANMLRDQDNKFCADCRSKGPRWASWNLRVFICIRCAGIHRNLGVHISRVKSINLDSWTPEQIETIQKGGNRKASEKFEANLPSTFRMPQDDYSVEQFIRNKYEKKLYIAKDTPTASRAPQVKREQERERVKVKKQQLPTQRKEQQQLGVPRPPAQTQRATTPPTPSNLAPFTSPITASSSAPDLMALEAASRKQQQPQPVDLLTGMSPPPTSASQQQSPKQPSLGDNMQKSVKDDILSLYQPQPMAGYQAYTAHGHPVNSFYYQQQQAAAMRMAQQQQHQAVRMAQVKEVEDQMRQLKMRQGEQQPISNGQPFVQPGFQPMGFPGNQPTAVPQPGGHTLNPQLW